MTERADGLLADRPRYDTKQKLFRRAPERQFEDTTRLLDFV
jgi:hypothetical protein